MIGPVTDARVVIAAVALLLGVTACSGDDPEPIVAPTPSSSAPSDPSTSPVAGTAAPTMPPEAMGDDADSAAAFVKFYWETVNYAQATADVDALRELATNSCASCRAGAASLEEIFESGGDIVGGIGTVTVENTNFVRDSGVTSAVVEFEVASTRQRVNYPGDSEDQVVPAGTVKLRAVLDPAAEGWAMSYWGER